MARSTLMMALFAIFCFFGFAAAAQQGERAR
jgi:hypothetical protein